MSTDAQHFAEAVLRAFEAAGNSTDLAVHLAGGPSNTTLTHLRKVARGEATMNEPRSDTLRRIEAAAKWPAGEARRLWRSGTVGARQQDADYVSAPGDPVEGNVTLADVMREIKAMRERLDQIEGERGP